MSVFEENVWNVERIPLRNGVGETGTEFRLPINCTIVLARIEASEFFHVIVDGEPMPEILHKSADFFGKIAEWLRINEVRAEIDQGLY